MLKRKLDGLADSLRSDATEASDPTTNDAGFGEGKDFTTGGKLQSLVAAYKQEGYVVVPDALSSAIVGALQQECERLREQGQDLIEAGCVLEPVGTVGESHPSRTNPAAYAQLRPPTLRNLILGPHSLHPLILALLLSSSEKQASPVEENVVNQCPSLSESSGLTLPSQSFQTKSSPTPCMHFFNEHYIVKPPHSESRFSWHTDAGEQLMMCYLDPYSTPYLSLWCPLDTMTERNGTLEVWPGSHLKGVTEPPDKMEGVLLTPPAGSVVLFSSTLWHRSGRNLSEVNRRAYYIQFSLTPIAVKEGPVSHAIPIPVP